MASGIVSGLVLLLVAGVLVVAVIRASRHRMRLEVSVHDHADLIAIARTTRGWCLAGLAFGVVLAFLLASSTSIGLGRMTALAPMALAAGVLLGTIIGELGVRVPQGPTRMAVLENRSARGLLNHPQALSALIGALALGAVLGIGSALGSPDDLGRAGRSLARQCWVTLPDGERAELTSARGPWPGSFYTLPLGVAALVLLCLAAVALAAISRRQRPAPTSVGLDTVLRSWATGNVLTALSGVFLVTSGALALTMLMPLAAADCRPTGQLVLFWVLFVTGPVALCGGLIQVLSLLLGPRIVLDDRPPRSPGDVAPVGVPVP